MFLAALAIVSLVVAAACALTIAFDIFVLGHRQRMRVMEVVWPVTALYLGPLAVVAYGAWGRPASAHSGGEREKPFPAVVAVGVTHCGAGCTLGDIAGAFLIFVLGIEIAGRSVWPELAADYILAFALGIVFQYLAIAPMRGLGLRDGLVAAFEADALSLTAFEIGMFGWMLLAALVLTDGHPPMPDEPVYWLSMQVGMVLGFATAYPVNWWLIRSGIKEAM